VVTLVVQPERVSAPAVELPMLELSNVEVIYSDVILAVKGITLAVPKGSCVTLLGGNGAGKSTTLKSISNVLKTEDGKVTSGAILFESSRIDGGDPAKIVRNGIVHVMEGRRVLSHLTVEQNLIAGGHMEPSAQAMRRRLDSVYDRIKRLSSLKSRTTGYLSGGEQQMVVIGRALMANPKLIMIDEPSLGLAPMMIDEVFGVLRSLKDDGLTLLIVEQNTRVALDLADFGYVMEDGRIVLEGNATDLRANEDIREFYLGLNLEGERKSYRNIKHYRRRKRWLG
jgi:branched-chain amino acid transport system ATP-binding protein